MKNSNVWEAPACSTRGPGEVRSARRSSKPWPLSGRPRARFALRCPPGETVLLAPLRGLRLAGLRSLRSRRHRPLRSLRHRESEIPELTALAVNARDGSSARPLSDPPRSLMKLADTGGTGRDRPLDPSQTKQAREHSERAQRAVGRPERGRRLLERRV